VETDSTMVKVARSMGIYVGDPQSLPPTTLQGALGIWETELKLV